MTAAIPFAFPLGFDAAGRTATRDEDAHIRDMIEQLLLTRPGERVNRPDFGGTLMHAVFGAASPEAATALQLTSRAALHRYLGDLIEVRDLTVQAVDAALQVEVRYLVRRTAEVQVTTFVLGAAQ